MSRIGGTPKQRTIPVVQRIDGITTEPAGADIPSGLVKLQVEAFRDGYALGYSVRHGLVTYFAKLPAAPLSSEKTGGFTGVFIGMYAFGHDGMPPADFAWFDYEALDD